MTARRQRPNILLIMTDQQRYDSLGCYGLQGGCTPNLDALARAGAVFEHCYVSNPICTPSRASLMTGLPLPDHTVHRLHDELASDFVLLPERLRQMGYQTALFGKLHVSGAAIEAVRRHPNDGFDVYEWCMEPSLMMDSPFNGYARWLRVTNRDFHDRLAELKRQAGHIPHDCHMSRWAAERTMDFIDGRDPNELDNHWQDPDWQPVRHRLLSNLQDWLAARRNRTSAAN